MRRQGKDAAGQQNVNDVRMAIGVKCIHAKAVQSAAHAKALLAASPLPLYTVACSSLPPHESLLQRPFLRTGNAMGGHDGSMSPRRFTVHVTAAKSSRIAPKIDAHGFARTHCIQYVCLLGD